MIAKIGWVVLMTMVSLGAAPARNLEPMQGRGLSEEAEPLATRCSLACDGKAGDCVDACEERYTQDKPRVECKLACIEARRRCEKDCVEDAGRST